MHYIIKWIIYYDFKILNLVFIFLIVCIVHANLIIRNIQY